MERACGQEPAPTTESKLPATRHTGRAACGSPTSYQQGTELELQQEGHRLDFRKT